MALRASAVATRRPALTASRRRSASLAIDGSRQGDDLVERSAVLAATDPMPTGCLGKDDLGAAHVPHVC